MWLRLVMAGVQVGAANLANREIGKEHQALSFSLALDS